MNKFKDAISAAIRQRGDTVVVGHWHDHSIAVHVLHGREIWRGQPEDIGDYVATNRPSVVTVEYE